MDEVRIRDLSKIADLYQRNIDACKIGDRTTVEFTQATTTVLLSNKAGAVWVDDLEDPHALLVITLGKFAVLDEEFGFINSIYIDPEHRSTEKLEEMLALANEWCRSRSCDRIQVSSWVYQGCPDLSKVWESNGFERQEIIYTKKA